MKKILLLNGPNLNLLGVREKSIYGDKDFISFFEELKEEFPDVDLTYFQANGEGSIIDEMHRVGFEWDGIVLNAGAYTHTSIAIADAIAAVNTPVVEVHISNVHQREEFRQHSYLSPHCKGVILGFGLNSYRLGILSLMLS